MSKEKWLNKKLCTFHNDKVRIELGPQIIELPCTDENLSNSVTSTHYKMGGIDAMNRFIRPDEQIAKQSDKKKAAAMQAYVDYEVNQMGRGIIKKGEDMACVDWRAIHVPHVWKVYVLQQEKQPDEKAVLKIKLNGEPLPQKETKPVERFIKVAEFEDRDEALIHARGLV